MPQPPRLPTKSVVRGQGSVVSESRQSRCLDRPLTTGHWSLLSRGQASLDYAVFISVVVAALVAMQLYVRRSIQANLKMLEDQVNAEAVPTALASGATP